MEECDLKFVDGINPLTDFLGELLYCKLKTGRTFTTKLIGINGRDLIFESRRGLIFINSIDDLAFVSIHQPHPEAV